MRNATPVLPFKKRRPTRRHYFLRVNFRPFSFFMRTTRAKINPGYCHASLKAIVSLAEVMSFFNRFHLWFVKIAWPSHHYESMTCALNAASQLVHNQYAVSCRPFGSVFDRDVKALRPNWPWGQIFSSFWPRSRNLIAFSYGTWCP